jgi:hypothetical protein
MPRPQKITFGQMCESGVRGVLARITSAAIRWLPAPINGRIILGFPILSRVSSVLLVASAELTSGRTSAGARSRSGTDVGTISPLLHSLTTTAPQLVAVGTD